MTPCQIVRLESIAFHIGQTGFVRLNHTVNDLCGRHFANTHKEELNQTDTNATNCGIDPQHEGHVIEEDAKQDHQ